jgi:hypothetical protein
MLYLLETLWWKYRSCPRTIEAAAHDFLIAQNPERVRAVLADPDSWYDFYVTDFRRRIAATYGLASGFNVHSTEVWSPGWNRWLLAAAGPGPEVAAERILGRVREMARLRLSTSSGEPEVKRGDSAGTRLAGR